MSNEILKRSADSGRIEPFRLCPFTAVPAPQGAWLPWALGLSLPRSASTFLYPSWHLKVLTLVVYPCMHQAGYNEINIYIHTYNVLGNTDLIFANQNNNVQTLYFKSNLKE